MKSNRNLSGLLYIVVAATLFGVMPVFSKFVLQSGINSLSLVFIRYFLAFISLLS